MTIQGNNVLGAFTNGTDVQDLCSARLRHDQDIEGPRGQYQAKPEEESPWYMNILVSWLPMLLLVGVWIFFMRQMQVGGGKAMSFGKSKARLLNESSQEGALQ